MIPRLYALVLCCRPASARNVPRRRLSSEHTLLVESKIIAWCVLYDALFLQVEVLSG
jgi:hypothetical protein